jgi:adenylyl- and sulfurtransferase ThiI
VHPEEEALIRERAERYGISYPVAVRQILRRGLGLNSVFCENPNEMGGKK